MVEQSLVSTEDSEKQPGGADAVGQLDDILSMLLSVSMMSDRLLERFSRVKFECEALEARLRSAKDQKTPFKDDHGRLSREGKKLLDALLDAGRTQAQAAQQIGISRAAVSIHVKRRRSAATPTDPDRNAKQG